MTVYGTTAGRIEGFREGWAVIPFVRKPHYWKRLGLTREYESACGLTIGPTHSGVKPLAPGVFMVERCKHCIRRYPGSGVHRSGDANSRSA